MSTSACHVLMTDIISVQHYKELCSDSDVLCFSGHSKSTINGFNYEWGYNYELRVIWTELVDLVPKPEFSPKPPRSANYQLVEIVSKTKAPENSLFSMISYPELITKESYGNYKLGLGEKMFTCIEPLCTELDQLLAAKTFMLLEFRHDIISTNPLKLTTIKCVGEPYKCHELVPIY